MFLEKFELKFSSLPPWRGGMKIEVITKLVIDPNFAKLSSSSVQVKLN